MILANIMFLEIKIPWRFIGYQMRAPTSESEPFQSDSKIAMEEIFHVDTATPGMIAAQEAVVCPKDRLVVRDLSGSAGALRFGEGVGTPDADVPFLVAIPFRAWSRLRLFH